MSSTTINKDDAFADDRKWKDHKIHHLGKQELGRLDGNLFSDTMGMEEINK